MNHILTWHDFAIIVILPQSLLFLFDKDLPFLSNVNIAL